MSVEKLSDLSLFPATREQTIESRRRTHPQWAKGLSMDEWLRRDELMEEMEFYKDGKLVIWVLAPRNDPKSLNFRCSCETIWRTGVFVRHGETKAVSVPCYGIAGVFTPPKNRGKGYARHMMRLLHWVLAPKTALPAEFPTAWGEPPERVRGVGDAGFSALYSDVGEDFYSACGVEEASVEGWDVRGPVGTVWELPKARVEGTPTSRKEWVWLDEDEMEDVWKQDVELMKRDVEERARETGRVQFSYLPDHGVAGMQVKRTMEFLPGLETTMPMEKWGVALKTGNGFSATAYATWTLDVLADEGVVIITRIRAERTIFKELIAKVMEAAGESGKIVKVEVWNLPAELEEIAGTMGGKTEKRNEHLSAFKWYGVENNDDVDWAFNEKFCWC
ncbi:hypothetical protein JAAARDRAFT_150491 [Jaapia argillacea MUCL 33604]|uniref:LYC1 C-terminal domain-containing protein n=1 Tax=Jaapia argillacea MUCL 33604 TaxID=933084 RepID=A0A067Q3S0_9AGAM|nr:hypothetical protein JAAARDRAFT_150491 [Jaapia argillacea MUCL 33604]